MNPGLLGPLLSTMAQLYMQCYAMNSEWLHTYVMVVPSFHIPATFPIHHRMAAMNQTHNPLLLAASNLALTSAKGMTAVAPSPAALPRRIALRFDAPSRKNSPIKGKGSPKETT